MNKRQKQLKRIYGNKKHKYTKQQLWSLYPYLTDHIYYALKQFKNQKLHSYPADLKSIEEWRNVLDQIMWAMNEISKDYPNDPLIRFYNTALTKEKYSHEEEEKTRKESDVYFKRIDNGLLLFTKYLRDLWD